MTPRHTKKLKQLTISITVAVLSDLPLALVSSIELIASVQDPNFMVSLSASENYPMRKVYVSI